MVRGLHVADLELSAADKGLEGGRPFEPSGGEVHADLGAIEVETLDQHLQRGECPTVPALPAEPVDRYLVDEPVPIAADDGVMRIRQIGRESCRERVCQYG